MLASVLSDVDERLLFAAVSAAVVVVTLTLALFCCDSFANDGLNCTISAVMLSQPVPSPNVSGAKHFSNNCRTKRSLVIVNNGTIQINGVITSLQMFDIFVS